MKIPFSIKYRPQIESGEYRVETRDGRPVHILSYDVPGEYCIVGVMTPNDGSNLHYPVGYTIKGTECSYPNSRDLFIITPDPELTEFEKALSKCLCDAVVRPEEEDYDKWAKEYAPELLELARKELGISYLVSPEAFQKRTGVIYVQGVKDGKAEALKEIEQDPESSYAFKRGVEYGKEEAWKDLPMWRIWKDGACGNSDGHPIAIVKSYGGYKLTNSLGIGGEKYIMLADLEKLPGFEEEQK